MERNPSPGDNHRKGAVASRSQTFNSKTDSWVERDTETGRLMDRKSDDKPFKGVRKEKAQKRPPPNRSSPGLTLACAQGASRPVSIPGISCS